ncbi:DciA family protein [Streptomyces sp. NPDC058008]|uniref:DciA family protein n=1 Tax=Streptomyces sp. NPDC058008 TaxID=3346303 RepID=UPI0036E7BF7B
MPEHRASGADLARLAFQAARAAAKTRPTTQPKLRTARPARGERRDPAGLGNILGNLTTELGWQTGVQGGDLLTQWPDLCPQYVGRVEPAHYDTRAGRLDLRPSSPAYATQLRLLGGQLCKQINDKLGSDLVRSIRVLPVGALPGVESPSRPAAVTPAADVDPGPVKTRETASPGYRAALAAVRRPEPRTVDPHVLEAIARQDQDAAREPEAAFAATVAAMEETVPAAIRDSERARLAAVDRKYGAGDQTVRTIFGAA